MSSALAKFKTVLVISILSLALHPALVQADTKLVYGLFWRGCEETCQGFQEYFSEAVIDARIEIRNAAQDHSKLPGFLQEARDAGADLILTWGTSATLGIIGTMDDVDDPRFNHTIPHVFTLVADPVGAQIVKSLEATGRENVTGTFNRVPEAVNINAIRAYVRDFRRLGLIVTPQERNSILKSIEIAALADPMEFELVSLELATTSAGIPDIEDIAVKIGELKSAGVDFIYLGSSSFLEENIDIFTNAAIEAGIPILSPYEATVRNSGALMSIAAGKRDTGRLAAQQAEKILVDGATPGDLPVAKMTDFAYVVNMDVARRLNLYPPVSILQIAETVN
jgi:putative ABC transport system substrate-binding protein